MADNALMLRTARLSPGGVEKAAILLLTLGPEVAANVFQHLNEAEVRQLSAAIARLRSISKEQAAAVHEEAWRRLSNRDGYLVDGEGFAKTLVTTALGPGRERQTQAMLEIERATQDSRVLMATNLGSVAPSVLAQVLGTEHPQVIAFILANLPPRQAAEVLAKLPEEHTSDLVLRIADLKRGASPEVLAEVSHVLQGQAKGLGGAADAGPAVGGMKHAAEIMNLLDNTIEGRVMAQLDEQAPDVAERIRDLMLTFEDLHQLENRDMQTLLKDVPREDLILALKTASPTMREKIFKNISARAAEILQDDMSTMGPVKLKDVEKAQASIVSVARRLADEQRITIGGSGGDALV